MYSTTFMLICGLYSLVVGNDILLSTTDVHEEKKGVTLPLSEQLETLEESPKMTRDNSQSSNPISALQNFFGNGNSDSAKGMPPVMVLGMHQAVIIPLNALPNIFQSMMNGMFNTGNSQQNNNLIPGIQNVMGR